MELVIGVVIAVVVGIGSFAAGYILEAGGSDDSVA